LKKVVIFGGFCKVFFSNKLDLFEATCSIISLLGVFDFNKH